MAQIAHAARHSPLRWRSGRFRGLRGRLGEDVACGVAEVHDAGTAALWDTSAAMLEGPDGMTLRAHPPGLSPCPVDLRLSTLARGRINLVVLRPTTGTARQPGETDSPTGEGR